MSPRGSWCAGGRPGGAHGAGRAVRRAACALLAAALALAPARGTAQESGGALGSWRQVRYGLRDGITSPLVSALAESSDGTVWVGHANGVAWFDGWRWRRARTLPQDLMSRQPQRLRPMRGDSMLVVMHNLLFVGDTSGFRQRVVQVDGKQEQVRDAVWARDGLHLLVAFGTALDSVRYMRWTGDRAEPLAPPAPLRGFNVPALFAAPDGEVWLNTTDGLYRRRDGAWTLRVPAAGVPLRASVLRERADGTVLAGLSGLRGVTGTWTWRGDAAPVRNAGEGDDELLSAALDGDSAFFAVRRGGYLRRLDRAGWGTYAVDGVPLTDVRAVLRDRRGDLWVGTGQGVVLLRESSRLWRGAPIGFPSLRDRINSLLPMPGGDLWAGTADGIDIFHPDGRVTHIAEAGGVRLRTVTALARDSAGHVWVGSGSDLRGALRHDGRTWRHYTARDGLGAVHVHRIVVSPRGAVWFLGIGGDQFALSEGPGAWVLEGGRFDSVTTADGLPSGRVYDFAEARDGTQWFATVRGLSRRRDGAWTHWTSRRGRAGTMNFRDTPIRVFTLALDSTGTPWFGDSGGDFPYGLATLEADTLRTFGVDLGLLSTQVRSVQVGRDGTVWVGTTNGLSALHDGTWYAFGTDRGLGFPEIWPLVVGDDEVAIGTLGGGLRRLSLAELRHPAPRVFVDSPTVGTGIASLSWSAYAWRGYQPAALVETRYRFDGGAWSAWSVARSVVAPLDGGRHVFEVQAKGLFAPLDGPVAQVTLDVPGPLLQRPEFLVPVLSLIAFAAALAWQNARRQRRDAAVLRASEERFETMFRRSPTAITLAGWPDGRIVDVSDGFTRLTGYDRAGVAGRTTADIALYHDAAQRAAVVHALSVEGRVDNLAVTLRRRDGMLRETLATVERVEILGREYSLAVLTDITERRLLEAQLLQSQKMEAVGRLAGGVAHDFNNLLTVILGNADTLRHAELREEDRADVEEIHLAAQRAADLTRQLLTFARKQRIAPELLDLGEVIPRTQRLLARLLGERIAIDARIAPDVPLVLIDAGQLEQVLVNLAVNARDAMPQGGRLSIEAGAVVLDETYAREHTHLQAGRYALISISDTGVGIPADALPRIFEPFFTTKEVGQGTGLGLAICYGIVREAGGHIAVYSELGRGTTVRVYLPARTAARRRTPVPEPRALAGGSESVLVVEDEALVRSLVERVLRSLGYAVTTAGDHAEALAALDRLPAPPDLLVTDVVLPGPGGPEIARAVRGRAPGVAVLYISGYTERGANVTSALDAPLLSKPFTPEQLATSVRQALAPADGKPGAPGTP